MKTNDLDQLDQLAIRLGIKEKKGLLGEPLKSPQANSRISEHLRIRNFKKPVAGNSRLQLAEK